MNDNKHNIVPSNSTLNLSAPVEWTVAGVDWKEWTFGKPASTTSSCRVGTLFAPSARALARFYPNNPYPESSHVPSDWPFPEIISRLRSVCRHLYNHDGDQDIKDPLKTQHLDIEGTFRGVYWNVYDYYDSINIGTTTTMTTNLPERWLHEFQLAWFAMLKAVPHKPCESDATHQHNSSLQSTKKRKSTHRSTIPHSTTNATDDARDRKTTVSSSLESAPAASRPAAGRPPASTPPLSMTTSSVISLPPTIHAPRRSARIANRQRNINKKPRID
jgi:hypothetical protein